MPDFLFTSPPWLAAPHALTVAGVQLDVEASNMVRVDAFADLRNGRLREMGTPYLVVKPARPSRYYQRRHRKLGHTSLSCGKMICGRLFIVIFDVPSITAARVRETLLHELAHVALTPLDPFAPKVRPHGPEWRSLFRLASEQYFGVERVA